MKQFRINRNDAGQRADKFVSKVTVGLPSSLLYKMFRKKRIKLNGARCAIDVVLAEGDLLELYLNDEFFPASPVRVQPASQQFDLLYEDNHLLIVDKPVGLSCHANVQQSGNTLIDQILYYLSRTGSYQPEREHSFTPALCNRIDRNTQGIVIAAKDAAALRMVNQKLRQREIEKHYRCIVIGVPVQRHAILRGHWVKDAQHNRAQIFTNKQPGSKEVCTEYWVLSSNGHYSLLDVMLHTGRSHQIRAQLASIGHPLLGDGKYASTPNPDYPHQLLCSYQLRFAFTSDAGVLNPLNHRSFTVKHLWFEDVIETLF